MQPPAPDHASMEEGDPLPCPEDEEFFNPGLTQQIWKRQDTSMITLSTDYAAQFHNIYVNGKENAKMTGDHMKMLMLSLKKSATLDQTDTWRKERRLRLHHACITNVVEMVNRFGSEDKHLLCADGQVHTSTDQYIIVRTGTYAYVPSCTDE